MDSDQQLAALLSALAEGDSAFQPSPYVEAAVMTAWERRRADVGISFPDVRLRHASATGWIRHVRLAPLALAAGLLLVARTWLPTPAGRPGAATEAARESVEASVPEQAATAAPSTAALSPSRASRTTGPAPQAATMSAQSVAEAPLDSARLGILPSTALAGIAPALAPTIDPHTGSDSAAAIVATNVADAATAQTPIDSSADPFIPLASFGGADLRGPTRVIRVRLPRASLTGGGSLTGTVAPLRDRDDGSGTVQADILVGEDGLARAIRLAR
jgi:hypothetical protein